MRMNGKGNPNNNSSRQQCEERGEVSGGARQIPLLQKKQSLLSSQKK
jgi:hypothetical protein